jgi:hypothetical protein
VVAAVAARAVVGQVFHRSRGVEHDEDVRLDLQVEDLEGVDASEGRRREPAIPASAKISAPARIMAAVRHGE